MDSCVHIDIIKNLGDHSVPAEWKQYVKHNEDMNSAPGAPIAWEKASQPEEVQAGYGFIPDNESEETFYYHSDHLGSTSYITDDSARITQYTAYLPYGELLVDEHSSSEDMPYKFNGKELDEETGLYYYGARYMQPITSVWYGIDPLTEKYPDVSAYTYCMGNPVKLVDSDGRKILFVNGYWISGYIGRKIIGSEFPKEKYWGPGFAKEAQKFFKDYSVIQSCNYIDGSSKCGIDMSGGDRYKAGYQYAKDHIDELTSGMKDGESFNMVTHSEGSAYGAGIAQYLLDAGYNVDMILHLSSDEGDEFSTPESPYTLQLSYQKDWVTGNHIIKNVDKVGEIVKGNLRWDEVHGRTKDRSVFKKAKDLLEVRLQTNIGMLYDHFITLITQLEGSAPNGTRFYSINGCILERSNGTKKY